MNEPICHLERQYDRLAFVEQNIGVPVNSELALQIVKEGSQRAYTRNMLMEQSCTCNKGDEDSD